MQQASHPLVYKQLPELPVSMALCAPMEEDLVEWGSHHVEELLGLWEEILAEVGQDQANYDANMMRNYIKQRGLAWVDVWYEFTSG